MKIFNEFGFDARDDVKKGLQWKFNKKANAEKLTQDWRKEEP